MGINSSMITALSGLSASQSQIDVVGNNIANVNTAGFKSARIDFKTQFLSNFSFGSAPSDDMGGTNPLQTGLGVTQGAITKNFTNGGLQVTGVPTNLAIQGTGMFILQSGGQQVYTRDGSFKLDGNNQLVSSTGAYVQGYGVDANFNVVPGALQDITIPVGSLTIAAATTNTTLAGNLNAAGNLPTSVSTITSGPLYLSDGAGGVDAVNPPTGTTLLTNVTDASGTPMFQVGDVITLDGTKGSTVLNQQTMTVTATTTLDDLDTFINGTLGIDTSAGANGLLTTVPGVSVGASGNTASITINGNLGTANDLTLGNMTITRGGATSYPLQFSKTASADGDSVYTTMQVYDSLGAPVTVKIVASLTSLTDGSTWTYYATSPDQMPAADGSVQSVVGMGTLNFDANGRLISTSNNSLTVNRAGTGAMPNLTFNLDFSEVTSFADSGSSVLNMVNRDGLSMGTLQSFQIGSDGLITGTFSNGLSRDLGQIALAVFRNEQGLIDQGNNNFIAGPNSGNAMILTPSQLGTGTIAAGTLELSNVDLSNEFVALIMASTAFSANSRVISSSNTMLQELLAAIR
ncbi:MAG: flagellar hook-basal body complex protein [Phycisphaerales bacterium]|nr:flagellar hook-basal body complex protein [Phycisphaerales bacterium]